MKMRSTIVHSAAVAALLCATHARGTVVAYWNFESNTYGTAADGAPVPHMGADGAFDGSTPDLSGNGNDLSPWNDSWAGFHYTTITPYGATPQTGAANHFAIQNNAGYPALSTNGTGTSVPGAVNALTMTPLAWTIEASYKPENTNGWRTVVGRDAQSQAGADGNVAALYFQITPDNRFRIAFVDVTGAWHEAASPAQYITNGFAYPNSADGQFYNLAATSDGTTLKAYVDGVLVGSTDMTGSSTDTRLSNGSTGLATGGGWAAGEWTVGRGLYAGGHTDRAYGLIDDVRISDTALAPVAFLSSVPEPAGLASLAIATGARLSMRRRRLA
jgi:hypothetical protein